MHCPTDRIAHTTAFVTPVVEHWLQREIAQCIHPMKDRSDDPSHHERTLLPRSYVSLPCIMLAGMFPVTNRNFIIKVISGSIMFLFLKSTQMLKTKRSERLPPSAAGPLCGPVWSCHVAAAAVCRCLAGSLHAPVPSLPIVPGVSNHLSLLTTVISTMNNIMWNHIN